MERKTQTTIMGSIGATMRIKSTPHPVIVTARDKDHYIKILLYSCIFLLYHSYYRVGGGGAGVHRSNSQSFSCKASTSRTYYTIRQLLSASASVGFYPCCGSVVVALGHGRLKTQPLHQVSLLQ